MVLLFWQKETKEESGLRGQIELVFVMLSWRCSGIFCNEWHTRDTWKLELRTQTDIYLEDICTEVITEGLQLDQPPKKGGSIQRKDLGVILGKYLPHCREWKKPVRKDEEEEERWKIFPHRCQEPEQVSRRVEVLGGVVSKSLPLRGRTAEGPRDLAARHHWWENEMWKEKLDWRCEGRKKGCGEKKVNWVW